TLAVETAGGLGRYALDVRLDAGSSGVAQTLVDQWEAASESISSSGKTYGFTATYSGIFTVEAGFEHGRGDVDLELVDSSGRRLAASTSSKDGERIDVTLSAGETVYLRVSTSDGLTNPDVGLRVTNLVSRQGGALVVRGTSGADQFQFVAGSAWRVTINGASYEMSGDSVSRVQFDGLAGPDTATLYGTQDSDSAVLRVGSADLSGAGYSVSVANSESIELVGRGGSDSVSMSDSAGNDVFTASPGYAAMTGSSYSLVARQFQVVHAYARYGGQDEAVLNDSAGDDLFTATTDGARMAGDDYLVRVRLFDTVHAYARNGGSDRARMIGSSVADTVIATPQYTRLVTREAVIRTKLFEEVEVLGGGGSDSAYVSDSVGNDSLVASPDAVTISGAGYANTLRGFTRTVSTASSGGADSAIFYGSAGADAFFADATEAHMSGAGYDNLARGFRNVTARAGGGDDQATLVDSALDDHLAAWGNVAQMQSSAVVAWVFDFDQVRAVSRSGGNDLTEIHAVDFVLQVSGAWDRD
ncbi:MAG: hypothetical protein ACYC6Y_21925, partial [Thermoguttaceae bacterium]